MLVPSPTGEEDKRQFVVMWGGARPLAGIWGMPESPSKGKEQFIAHLVSHFAKEEVQHFMPLDFGSNVYHTLKVFFNLFIE